MPATVRDKEFSISHNKAGAMRKKLVEDGYLKEVSVPAARGKWEAQMRHFGRRYRCAAFNARGYPPSDVPASQVSYSQGRAADDIR